MLHSASCVPATLEGSDGSTRSLLPFSTRPPRTSASGPASADSKRPLAPATVTSNDRVAGLLALEAGGDIQPEDEEHDATLRRLGASVRAMLSSPANLANYLDLQLLRQRLDDAIRQHIERQHERQLQQQHCEDPAGTRSQPNNTVDLLSLSNMEAIKRLKGIR
ncbi:unnamed protein product, partial [Protopolystoma xenopodis]